MRLQLQGRACMATAYRPTSVGAVLFAPDAGLDASSSSAAPQDASSVRVLHLMGHAGPSSTRPSARVRGQQAELYLCKCQVPGSRPWTFPGNDSPELRYKRDPLHASLIRSPLDRGQAICYAQSNILSANANECTSVSANGGCLRGLRGFYLHHLHELA
jgi:hypothetical protein